MDTQSWDHLKSLFLKYREGDSTQVNPLFTQLGFHIEKFYSFKSAKSGSADLTQQTLLKVHLSRDSFDATKNLKTWIFTIAQNTMIDTWRKQKEDYLPDTDDSEDAIEDIRDLNTTHDKITEIREQLTEMMSTLKPFDQKIVYLYGWEQLSTNEISQITGLSEPAVKVRIHRLLKGLRRLK